MEEKEHIDLEVVAYDNPCPIHDDSQAFDLGNIASMCDAEIQQRDHRGFSILMVAAENGNNEAVNYLINRGENLDYETNGVTAASLAFTNGHHGIVLSLIKANANIPNNYNHETASDELKDFINLSEKMHERVRSKNSFETENFIKENAENYPSLRHFYNTNNVSLLKTAILHKMFEIYKILLSLNIILGPHECVDDIMSKLNSKEQRQLRNINEELSTNIFTDEMMILMRNCKLGPGVTDQGFYIEFIRKAFDFLFKIPSIGMILKLVAARYELKIIFDFERDSVQFLDPSAEPYTNGLFYPSGKIYVAAKDMLEAETAYKVYSVMAHELCHFAMFLTFNNNARPYRENETQIEAGFEKIAEECRIVSNKEECVDSVFDDYPEDMWHAELIVRVPQMIVTYFNNQNLLDAARENFPSLFDLFESTVVVEMERELPKLEKKFYPHRKLQKTNKKLKLFIIILLLSFVLLIPLSLFTFYYFYPEIEPIYSWDTLSSKEKFQFKNATVNFYDTNVTVSDLFGNYSEIYEKLPSEHIKFGLKGCSKELSDVLMSFYKEKIFLNFSNMTKSLKRKFVRQKVDFQGQNVTIKEILMNHRVLSTLNFSQVHQIFEGKLMKISYQTEARTDFFIERFFTEEHQLCHSRMVLNLLLSDIIKVAECSKVLLLSSQAGEGKSEFFRHVSRSLKVFYPFDWVQFVDLKKHFKAYEKNVHLDLENFKNLMNFLTVDLLKLSKIESVIFHELYTSNGVIFLWDGMDEIAPLYKNFMLNLTSVIKNHTLNTQFISTRPQFSKDFKETLHTHSFKFTPIDEELRLKFIAQKIAKDKFESFWKTLNNVSNGNIEYYVLHSNATPELDEEYQRTFLILQKAQALFSYVDKSESLVTNPLLLQMISEILADGQLGPNLNLDFYSIYEKFVDKKLEIVRNEKGEIVGKDLDKILKTSANIMHVHQAYALKLIFGEYLVKRSVSLSALSIMNSISKFKNSQVSRFGILDIISDLDFTFIHRTFAEYFVTRFLIDSFDFNNFDNDSNRKFYLLDLVLFSGDFELIKRLLISYAKMEDEGTNFLVTFTYLRFNFELNLKNDEIEFDIALMRKKVMMLKNNLRETLPHVSASFDESANSLKTFTNTAKQLSSKSDIFDKEIIYGRTFIANVVLFGHSVILEILWIFIERNLNEEKMREILLVEDQTSQTLLQLSASNVDARMFLLTTEIYKRLFTDEQIRNILSKTEKNYLPFIANVILCTSDESASKVSEYLNSLFKNEKIELRRFLSKRDNEDYSIFNFPPIANLNSSNDIKWENNNVFNKLLLNTFDDNQKGIASLCLQTLKHDLKDLENFQDVMLAYNHEECISADFKKFITKPEIILKSKIILMRKNSKNESVLNEIISNDANEGYIKEFLNLSSTFFNHTEILNFCYEQEGPQNISLLMNAAKRLKLEYFKIFWNFILQNLKEDEVEQLLLHHDGESRVALHHAMFNKDLQLFLYVRDIYEKVFTQNELRDILREINNSTLSDTLISIESDYEVCKYLNKLFKEDVKFVQNFLSYCSKYGEKIISSNPHEETNVKFDGSNLEKSEKNDTKELLEEVMKVKQNTASKFDENEGRIVDSTKFKENPVNVDTLNSEENINEPALAIDTR